MRLTSIAMLAIGFVLGSRAGREKYDQLSEIAQKAVSRLESQ